MHTQYIRALKFNYIQINRYLCISKWSGQDVIDRVAGNCTEQGME